VDTGSLASPKRRGLLKRLSWLSVDCYFSIAHIDFCRDSCVRRRASAGLFVDGSEGEQTERSHIEKLDENTSGTQVCPVKLNEMTAEIYPSGAWRGFYSYGAKDRHGMQLDLLFSGGIVAGDGSDDVGSFVMRGSYDSVSGSCRWTKTYIGSHDVGYSGVREGNGIAGTWELRGAHGTFRIWPGRGDTTGADESLEVPEPVEALTPG
jgi:hypothetical protein